MLANSDLLNDLATRIEKIKLTLRNNWHTITFANIIQRYQEFDQLGQTGDPLMALSLQREDEDPNSASKKNDSKAAHEKNLKISNDMAALAAPSAVGAAVQLAAPIVAPAPCVNVVGAVIAPWIAWADLSAKHDTLQTLHDIKVAIYARERGGGGPTLECTCQRPKGIIGWVPGGIEMYETKEQTLILSNACYQNVLYFIAKKENPANALKSVPGVSFLTLAYSAAKRASQWFAGKAGDKENHCRSLHEGARNSKCHVAMNMLHMICKEKKWYEQAYRTLENIREVDWELPPSVSTTKGESLRSVAIIVASDGWEQIKSCV